MTGRRAIQREPELSAAIVNFGVVLLLALALCALALIGVALDDTHAVVSAASPAARFFTNLIQVAVIVVLASLFALIAGWRTWAHARRHCTGRGTGWLGVAEGGAVGLASALLVLMGGILTHPTDAGPYIVAYGGAAVLLGLAVGLVLRFTALLTLRHIALATRGVPADDEGATYNVSGSSESGTR